MLDWDADEATKAKDREFLAEYRALAERHWRECRSQFARQLLLQIPKTIAGAKEQANDGP